MKKKYIYSGALIAAIVIIFKTIIFANDNGAQGGLCGAPDDIASNACGTGGCHNFSPIDNSQALVISLIDPVTTQAVTSYQAGVKYIVRVELTRASLKTCGFEATVETESGNNHVGTLAVKLKSQLAAFSGGKYITHINSSKTSAGYGKWEFYWTSPATTQGNIVIYAAGNAANGDNNNTGDSIFTTNKSYAFGHGAVENIVMNEADVKVFPNPVKDNFSVSYDLLKTGTVSVDLYDVEGRAVSQISNGLAHSGNNVVNANVSNLNRGVYFVKVVSGDQTVVRRILKF